MKLFFREAGAGDSVIILHGLLGMSDNWLSVSRILAEKYHVWIPDLRNHGRSSHEEVHNYEALSLDLIEFIEDHSIQHPTIIGHSMGGKIVMKLALKYPDMVQRIVVVDISPFSYQHASGELARRNQHQEILQAMMSLDLSLLNSRTEADQKLSADIPSERVRQFVMKNLHRTKDDRFHWLCNVDVLMQELPEIMKEVVDPLRNLAFCDVPALFMRGERSDYISDKDVPLIKQIFRRAEFVTIPGASHWVHADKPEIFLRELLRFIG